MSNKHKNNLYDLFFEQFIPTILEGTKNAGGRWPMPIFEQTLSVMNYSSPVIVREFMSAVDQLDKQGLSVEEIGRKFHYPSRLARLQHLFASRFFWGADLNDPITVAERFLSILSTMYRGNMFCKNGRNLIYTSEELGKFEEPILRCARDKKLSLAIAKIEKFLYLLSESYSPRFPNCHFEFSGPYKLKNQWIVIKEYHDLRPTVLPIKFYYSFNQLTVIQVYDREIDYKVDIMCRPNATNQNLPLPICNLLLVDNQLALDSGQISQYTEQITKSMQEAISHLTGLTRKEQIVEFNTQLEWLTLLSPIPSRPARDLSLEALDNFNNQKFQLKSERFDAWVKSTPKDEKGWRTIFDTRIKQVF